MSNIFALSTPSGKSGIAIIRISGENTSLALKSLNIHTNLPPRTAILCNLQKENGDIIDKAIVIYFPAPHSYTGQNILEFHTHGGRAIIQDLLHHFSTLPNYRYAEAGEFSRLAFENNKMDLTQLEGVADLIDAETTAQRKQAFRQMDGELKHLYHNWRNKLIEILAHIEAYIDFPDEDIPPNILTSITTNTQELKQLLQQHLNNKHGEILRNGLYITILGAPNSGKSSLINTLAKRQIAIVSSTAGTTRDIIEVQLNISDIPVTFADTAGLRTSDNEIEQQGIKIAQERAINSDLKICLFDSTKQHDQETTSLIDSNTIIVSNKSDLPQYSKQQAPNINRNRNKNTIQISTKTNHNIDKLLTIIEQKIQQITPIYNDPAITRQRHRTAITHTLNHLNNFIENITNQAELEICSEDLRMAAQHLGQATGEIGVEELLDNIFSSFCIGK